MRKKAFTLIEILLVMAIMAVLAGVVVVAINPGRQLSKANNTERITDVRAVLDSLYTYSIDNSGQYPSEITDVPSTIGSGENQIDICKYLVPKFLPEMPVDPTDENAKYTSCTDYNTGYLISVDEYAHITVSAPNAELDEVISMSR